MPLFSPTWFLEGFWHLLQTPSQLIMLIALAFLLGQQGKPFITRNLLIFFVSVGIGFVANTFYTASWNNESLLLILALFFGLLIALLWKLPAYILLLFSFFSGVLLGFDSSPLVIPGFGNSVAYNWFLGVATSIALIMITVSSLALAIRKLINGVILRVIGSWIATSALFVLTLLMVKH